MTYTGGLDSPKLAEPPQKIQVQFSSWSLARRKVFTTKREKLIKNIWDEARAIIK